MSKNKYVPLLSTDILIKLSRVFHEERMVSSSSDSDTDKLYIHMEKTIFDSYFKPYIKLILNGLMT